MRTYVCWKTKNPELIQCIRLRFGLSSYMSINRETPIRYVENDMPDLEKSIKLNFIELRTKQS